MVVIHFVMYIRTLSPNVTDFLHALHDWFELLFTAPGRTHSTFSLFLKVSLILHYNYGMHKHLAYPKILAGSQVSSRPCPRAAALMCSSTPRTSTVPQRPWGWRQWGDLGLAFLQRWSRSSIYSHGAAQVWAERPVRYWDDTVILGGNCTLSGLDQQFWPTSSPPR